MEEHRLEVRRSARYCTIGTAGTALRQVWFVCHGYGQLAAGFLRSCEALDDGTRLVVAPEGLSRFYLSGGSGDIGASWMTREDRLHEIADYVRLLDHVYRDVFQRVDRSRVTVYTLGFSQGAATATRWVAMGDGRSDHLILWGGEPPPELSDERSTARLRAVPITVVWGSRDQYASSERIAEGRTRLERSGIGVRVRTFEGGHRLDDDTLRRIAREEA